MKLQGNYKEKEEKRQTVSSEMVCGFYFCCCFFNWAIESSAVHLLAVKKYQMLTITICCKTAAGTYYTLVVVVHIKW